jgi:N-acyl-D-aspartate/D-glutamate deacylase
MKMIAKKNWLFVSLLMLFCVCCSTSYDVVIRGGTVYDGMGEKPYVADIGIVNGTIKKMGKIKASAPMTIDAAGLIAAPGFIDMHTHCESGLLSKNGKSAKNYLMQGVTTVVTGNCGGGTYKVQEFFQKLEEQGIGPNIIHLIGHGTIRDNILGQDDREPAEEELEEMKKLLVQGLEEGAAGLSSGLFYAPGSYAKTEEIIELAKVAKEYGGIYTTHIRDESNYTIGLKEAICEAILIGEKTGITVEISHLKALGKSVWGMAEEVGEIIQEARAKGINVYADQYPYLASSTGLSAAVIPRWVQAGGQMRERLTNPELLPRIKKETADNIDRRGGPESLVIVSYPKNREFDGKNLLAISKMLETSVVEAAILLVLEDNPSIISFNMQESDLEYFMKQPYVMTGSDGNVQIPGSGFPHPRSNGTFPRKIRKYVIDKKWITMEQAIRAATSLPAEVLGLDDRGMLKEGLAADIVVFDPDEISDKATYNKPHQYSVGVQYLLIDGKLVIEEGTYNGRLVGKPIRMNEKKSNLRN